MKKRKIFKFGKSIEVDEYIDGRFGARGEKRKEKKKVTPEQVKKQNQFNRTRKCRRLMKQNFKEGDLYWTFTFQVAKRPRCMLEAKIIWSRLQRKIRDICKREGKGFKWIIRIEKGSRGAFHMHLVMNAIEKPRAIAKLWEEYGHAHLEYMYEEGGFAELAAYLTKPEEEGEETYYSRSRNLTEPEPEIELVKEEFDTSGDIEIPQGYYLDKSSLINGHNPVTGYPFRHYTLVKIRGEDKAA